MFVLNSYAEIDLTVCLEGKNWRKIPTNMSTSDSESFYSSLESLSDPIDTEQLASEAVDLGIEAQLLDVQFDGATWSGMPRDDDPIAD